MSEFDQRQYRLMLNDLNEFRSGKIQIDALINNLEGLLNALTEGGEGWKKSFLRLWGQLEDARAYALFRDSEALDADSTQRVYAAVEHLKLLVLERMHDPIAISKDIDK